MKIDIVDWKLTGECPLRCLHCYGPPKTEKALDLHPLTQVVGKFKDLGIEWAVLTGGEPLVVPFIIDVMHELNNEGIKIALSTNTFFFRLFQESIEKYVSSLNIPLDGSTSEIHALSRRDELTYNTFFDILRYYKAYPKKKPELLRVSTVFSKVNKDDLINIAKKLEEFDEVIDTWKICELIDYEFQQKERKNILPRKGEFQMKVRELVERTSLTPKIMISPVSHKNKAYFMVNSKGIVVTPTDVEGVTYEFPIGNILNDPLENIVEAWRSWVIFGDYIKNHEHYYKIFSHSKKSLEVYNYGIS